MADAGWPCGRWCGAGRPPRLAGRAGRQRSPVGGRRARWAVPWPRAECDLPHSRPTSELISLSESAWPWDNPDRRAGFRLPQV